MQFTVDGLSILTAAAFVLWTVATAGVAFWAKRMSADRAELQKQIAQLSEKLETFQLTVAREYASRAEVRDEREETRALCARIESKITDLYNHMVGKK